MGESGSRLEERLNAYSHGLGVLLGFIGLFFLLQKSTDKTPYATLSILIYSLCLIALFTASMVYHAVSKAHLRKIYQIIDHIGIYLLIAGTYTPVALISLESGNGWTLFYTVWAIAAFGAVLKLFFTGKYELVSLLLYVVMGWLIILDFSNLREATTDLGINLLFGGGAFYTLGILFYANRKIPYNHFIWHLFVLGGAVCHWLFIYLDVV
ncbi:hemolysin III family protein [Flavobacteriaceae bacterium TP-CH-4]|uniref:Hemolysin III family protein n=2 Tax=Pelagihabitans pacificus TaxID=2696054 RepID=A0A967E8F5_9FLAO|nr:hemolysin III family protein [Pelagihabitans pacificus]